MSRMSRDIRDIQISDSLDPCDPRDMCGMRDMRIDYQKNKKNALSFGHLFWWSESAQLTANQEKWAKQDKTFTFLQLINKFRNESNEILHSREIGRRKTD